MNNTLPDKSVQLIIADPPYFEVKGEFDFVFDSFGAYLDQVEIWAKECKRLLADNGTLLYYGMDRKIAYSQVIFDKHFELLGTLVWEKPSIANEWDTRRTFPERGQERLLMYCNSCDQEKWEYQYHENMRQASRKVQDYLKSIITRDELANLLLKNGNCKNENSAKQNANNILSQKSHKPQMITREQYNWIACDKVPYDVLLKIFKDAYGETERDTNRRYFNNYLGLTDVLRFPREHNATHPTQKPEDLTRALILTCSRPNDTILIPFAGSGTECAMAAKEGRRFIGFDIEPKYVSMGNKRVINIQSQPMLNFNAA